MGISHGNRGNTILHIVIGEGGRGSEGLSLKIQPYVEDLFLAYLLVSICLVVITKFRGCATQRTNYGCICCNDIICVSAFIVHKSQ